MIGIDDLHEANPVRFDPDRYSPVLVLAPVWVMEDDYHYSLNFNRHRSGHLEGRQRALSAVCADWRPRWWWK